MAECEPEKVSPTVKDGKASVTFAKPGVYGFFCEVHGDKGVAEQARDLRGGFLQWR